MNQSVIKAANALMSLRGVTAVQVAESAGVNHENLRHFLNGINVPIQYDSVRSAFAAMGIHDGKMAEMVHYWGIRHSPFRSQPETYPELSAVMGLIKNAQLVEVTSDRRKGATAYLLKLQDGARIAIMDRHGWLRESRVPKTLGIEVTNRIHVVPQVWAMLANRDLSMMEFDMVFSGDATLSGWRNVRIAAREYGVTPKEIIDWVIAHRDARQTTEFKLELVVNNGQGSQSMLEDGNAGTLLGQDDAKPQPRRGRKPRMANQLATG